MPEQSRAIRSCAEDISHALKQLRAWRVDGCADKIWHWERRLDLLLVRWKQLSKEQSDDATCGKSSETRPEQIHEQT